MKDSDELTNEQERISQVVKAKASKLNCIYQHNQNMHPQDDCKDCGFTGKAYVLSNHNITISENSIVGTIKSLKKSPSSGCDGIAVSNLFHAISDSLIKSLHELYSTFISTSIVPNIF